MKLLALDLIMVESNDDVAPIEDVKLELALEEDLFMIIFVVMLFLFEVVLDVVHAIHGRALNNQVEVGTVMASLSISKRLLVHAEVV